MPERIGLHCGNMDLPLTFSPAKSVIVFLIMIFFMRAAKGWL